MKFGWVDCDRIPLGDIDVELILGGCVHFSKDVAGGSF